jgi:hypothetical protein
LLAGWKPEVDFQQMVKLMLEEERKSSGSG